MSLAENMNKIASEVKYTSNDSIVKDLYGDILEDIKSESERGSFELRLTNYDNTQKYKQIVSDPSKRQMIMTLLKNDGVTIRYVPYNNYWDDGKEEIVITW